MKKIQLTIPEPCHEKWEEMTPVDKGRYCNACQKTVIDFSLMTDAQLGAFFRRPPRSLCGRFHEDQLERDIIIPKKQIPWMKYFFQFTLPAFLLSLKSYAQKQSNPLEVVKTKYSKATYKTLSKEMKGQVLDSTGAPVPFATISVKNSTRSVAADENGNFEIQFDSEERTVIISAIGYETTECSSNDFTIINLRRKVSEMETVIIMSQNYRGHMAGGTGYRVSTQEIQAFPIISKLIDTVFSNISIYPNPVQRNSIIKIKASKVEEGDYVANIFDGKGAVIQVSSLTMQGKNVTVELPLNNVATGSYILNLRNRKNGKQYTKKFIVQ